MTTIYANNVAGTLAAGIGPSDTILLLGAGQGTKFPATGNFYATLVHFTTGVVEIVQVTARSVDSLTIVRGRDSTIAVAFNTGSAVEMRLCGIMLRDLDWRVARGAANGVASLDAVGLLPLTQLPLTMATQAELDAAIALYVPLTQRGAANGVATLDAGGLIPIAQFPLTMATQAELDAAIALYVPLTQRGAANGVATLDAGTKVPVAQIPDVSATYLLKANPSSTGNFASAGDVTAGGVAVSGQIFRSSTASVILAPGAAGPVYLRPNGAGSAVGEGVLGTDGILVVTNTRATSDKRLKKYIKKSEADAFLADKLEFTQWIWKGSFAPGFGVIAQSVAKVAPRYVGGDKVLSIDKASLALEAVIGLAARVRQLEKTIELLTPAPKAGRKNRTE